ncbi:MAG: serine hydrolase [Flavobacteriales bacterium]
MKFLFSLAVGLMISLTPWAQVKVSAKQIKSIDKHLQTQVEKWNIPGVAVAIVRGDEVLLSKGYGLKNINQSDPVDENTLFAVASNTKAFTATAIGMLVDEGKIDWDDKVQKHLPYFQLYDPYVSANMTVRDLLCHRSGLETFSGDLIWYGSNYSREEVVRRARFLEPKYDFRSHYGYQNIMFIAAGEIVAKVSGMSWDDFIKNRFFQPMGMNSSNTSVNSFGPKSNVATPHNEKEGVNHAIEWVNWDNIGGAGAINSSVNDMGKWLQCQLNGGKVDTTQLFSAQVQKETWNIQTAKSISDWSLSMMPSKTMNGYGLGWDIFNYQGRKIVTHGGGYDGMISQTVMIPEEDLAFVVLTNNINYLPFVLTYELTDMLLKAEDPTNLNQTLYEYKLEDQEAAKNAQAAAEEGRIKDTSPSLELDKYAGTYGGEMYGNCIIRVIGDQLAFQFEPTPIFRGTMRHWHYDTFQLNWGTKMMLPSGTVQFILGSNGEVDEMRIVVENPDFDFTELEFKKLE